MIELLGSRVLLSEIFEKPPVILINNDPPKPTGTAEVAYVGSSAQLIKVGQIVVLSKFGFEPIVVEGKPYLLGDEKNVVAIIKK